MLCNPMDSSPLGSPIHGISKARILEKGAISSFRESSWLQDRTQVLCISWITWRVPYHWTTWENSYTGDQLKAPYSSPNVDEPWTTQGLGVPMPTQSKIQVSLYSGPPCAMDQHSQVQTTSDSIVLQYYLLKKMSTYKWNCIVQTHIVLGLTNTFTRKTTCKWNK